LLLSCVNFMFYTIMRFLKERYFYYKKGVSKNKVKGSLIPKLFRNFDVYVAFDLQILHVELLRSHH